MSCVCGWDACVCAAHALLAVGEQCHLETMVEDSAGEYSLYIDTPSFLAELKFNIATVCLGLAVATPCLLTAGVTCLGGGACAVLQGDVQSVEFSYTFTPGTWPRLRRTRWRVTKNRRLGFTVCECRCMYVFSLPLPLPHTRYSRHGGHCAARL